MLAADVHDLAAATTDLCRHVLLTGAEAPLTDLLAESHRDDPLVRVGESLVVGAPDHRPLVVLVGHLDVVPPAAGDEVVRGEVRDGADAVVGRGTSDMKSGIAVARSLYADRDRPSWPYAVALVLYAGEEGSAESNQLLRVLAEVAWLRDAALAVVLEPTDLDVHVGCLGGLHAELTFRGHAAHSARPWEGENALTMAGELLAELHDRPPRDVTIDGIAYRDVLTATQASTSSARNVVPARFVVNLNYRFAPDRSVDDAEQELRAWVGDRAAVEVVDRAPPAPPRLDAPATRAFVAAVGAPVRGKQAWTDVARFAEIDVPALNYGPGLTAQAHQAGEYVPVRNLEVARERLGAFLQLPPG